MTFKCTRYSIFQKTCQILLYPDDVSLFSKNINTGTKYTSTPLDASRGASRNSHKEMIIFRSENAGQNYNLKKANKLLETPTKLSFFRTIIIYQNYIHKEIMQKLYFGYACDHSKLQNIFSFKSPPKHPRILKCICKTTN